ncbi:NADH-quinone oxidoreductase subunit J [Streptosporangium jomthongense]|uniref:NADH-quinone oxidoreductase subunit J n=1 Tax=Marinobacter aromaticivorans TaxID=1494078 RepID=A0ABW2ISV7_9GAMM|nr:NADH-quinone oxidoreductase subunit J [Marinobacter aromaticivorans]GGE59150.1 NADH-quinone oxidoreductase subunit J [Streptosporangium jomthongense]
MELAFYLSGLVAVLATLGVISNHNPVHGVLYLVVSLLAVAMVFFALGAPFAGALEIIVYAGAIMVLFVFVVMMLNLGQAAVAQERIWLQPATWLGPSLLATVLLVTLIGTLWRGDAGMLVQGDVLSAKQVGMILFGPWLLVVELGALLLLAALVTASHVGRQRLQAPGSETDKEAP